MRSTYQFCFCLKCTDIWWHLFSFSFNKCNLRILKDIWDLNIGCLFTSVRLQQLNGIVDTTNSVSPILLRARLNVYDILLHCRRHLLTSKLFLVCTLTKSTSKPLVTRTLLKRFRNKNMNNNHMIYKTIMLCARCFLFWNA